MEYLDMLELFPEQLHNKVTQEIIKVEEYFFQKEIEDLNKLVAEFNVMTAVESLPYHCDIAGIDYNPNIDIDTMRGNILVAYKSLDITTAEVIKTLVENYSNASCSVDDTSVDDVCFIKFINKVGIPSNLPEIKKALYSVSPAHVEFEFKFKYRTWGELKKTNMTYKQAKDKMFTGRTLREGDISPWETNVIG